MRPDRILIISGPTASGKSGLALALAQRYDGIVINADALQVYRELRILTARPAAADEQKAPHALYGHRSITETYSVADWLDDLRPVLETAWANGQLPIVTGGTGFYLQALLHGISPVPDVPDTVRQDVTARYDALGHDAYRAALRAVDPLSAERIKPFDRQRLIRATEVFAATGRPLSAWQSLPRVALFPALRSHSVLLEPPRDALYARIDARFVQMVETGALDEARLIESMRLPAHLPGLKALGLSGLRAHLRGETNLPEAIIAGQTASRQYAKRQMTWLRTQWRETDAHGVQRLDRPDAAAVRFQAL